MVRGKWDIVAMQLTTLMNVNRASNSPAVQLWDVHPYRTKADYLHEELRDADYHRDRRLSLLPPDQRRAVIAKWEAEREQTQEQTR